MKPYENIPDHQMKRSVFSGASSWSMENHSIYVGCPGNVKSLKLSICIKAKV